jgi:CRP-like cAMP-binding protein
MMDTEAAIMNNPKGIFVGFIKKVNNISLNVAEQIAENFTPITFYKQEYFLKEGHVNNDYLFLQEGIMRAFATNTEGNDVTTHFYSNKQIVVEVASYYQGTPSQESVQAITECKGWIAKKDRLNTLFHTVPEFREFGRSILAKGFVDLKERTLAIINQSAEERYKNLLQKNPEILQHVPLKFIASYLGVTDSSLSRIRKEIFLK